jgi:cardiolipin synthase
VQAGVQAADGSHDRVVTLPNALSLLRLLGVPLFLWLVLTERDALAVAVLMVSGFTDWLDGKIARRWNQTSRIGALLDPAADRLYIFATLVGLTVRDVVPLWLTVALVGRDLLLATTLPVLRRHGYGPLPVHFLGKAATFNLLAGFPLLLLGEGDSGVSQVAHAFGWAFAIWGTALYWWAGVLYVVQVRQLVSADRAAGPAAGSRHDGSEVGT